MTTTTPYRRSARRRRLITLAVVVVVGVLLAYATGFRLNVRTSAVPVPAVGSSADEVVRAYVAAYDARDFATMRAIYPSNVPSRFGVLGQFEYLRVVDSHVPSADEQSGRFPLADRQYRNVQVTLTVTHVGDSNLSYPAGPNGWTYWLERADDRHRWQIVDHGNG